VAEPIPHFDVELEDVSGRLAELVEPGTNLERIAGGLGFTEGPVWRGDHLLFSDIPNDRICRWRQLPEGPELTTFRAYNGSTNGLTLDREGRLLGCTHGARAVLRFDQNNQPTPVATHFNGGRLNSPTDIVVKRNGDIYFTDPPYGLASPEAARLAGIRVRRYIFYGFILSGLMIGLAGLIRLSQVGSQSINTGLGWELQVLTAVILGGASLSGGSGTVLGTVLALLVIGVLRNGLIQLNVQTFWIEVAQGALLLGAVTVDRIRIRLASADT